MKKVIKRIFITILCIPLLIIVAFIGYEIVGAIANSISSEKQTKEIVSIIDETSSEIIDTYTFTGNVSGTGNHVDMLSLIIVKTENINELEKQMQDFGCKITPLEIISDNHLTGQIKEMNIPNDISNCYLIKVCNSAPFEDNIRGH